MATSYADPTHVVDHDMIQKKSFTKWVNSVLKKLSLEVCLHTIAARPQRRDQRQHI